MERCPHCRARWEGGDACRRCGLEPGSLLACEAAAGRLTRSALARLADGDPAGALAELTQAQGLYREPMLEHLLGWARHEAVAGDLSEG